MFALAAALALAVIAVALLVLSEGACRATPEVAPRQLAVRVAALQAQLALAVASDAAFRHEQPGGAVAVAQIVGPVAGALAEYALGIALVDLAVLVADAAPPIAYDIPARAQEAVARARGSREVIRPARWPRARRVPALEGIGWSDLSATAETVAGHRRAVRMAATIAGERRPEVRLRARISSVAQR